MAEESGESSWGKQWSLAPSEVGWWHAEQLPFFQNFPKELGCLQGTAPVDSEPIASMAIIMDDLGKAREKMACSALEHSGTFQRDLGKARWHQSSSQHPEGGAWEQQ